MHRRRSGGVQIVWQRSNASIPHNTLIPSRSLEQLLCLLEEALAQGALLAVAKVGVFLELGLLGWRKVSGHLDVNADVQIPSAIALNILDALALQTEHRAGLGAGRNLDRGSSVQRRDRDVCAQSSLHKAYRHLAQQVIAVALEEGMGLDVKQIGRAS